MKIIQIPDDTSSLGVASITPIFVHSTSQPVSSTVASPLTVLQVTGRGVLSEVIAGTTATGGWASTRVVVIVDGQTAVDVTSDTLGNHAMTGAYNISSFYGDDTTTRIRGLHGFGVNASNLGVILPTQGISFKNSLVVQVATAGWTTGHVKIVGGVQ